MHGKLFRLIYTLLKNIYNLPCSQISVELSDLEQILVISTHEPDKVDFNAILKTMPADSPSPASNSSLPSSNISTEQLPSIPLSSTKQPIVKFIFNEVVQEIPSTTTVSPPILLNDKTVNTKGSFLIMDPQIGFEVFNTNIVKDSTQKKNESRELEAMKNEKHVLQTTERSFDYLMSRDVFIPQQATKDAPSHPSSLKNDVVTMEYDMNYYDNNYVDYAFNEEDIEQVPLYQDELDLPALDSSNNLYKIEIDIPRNSAPKSKMKDNVEPSKSEDFKEASTVHGRVS